MNNKVLFLLGIFIFDWEQNGRIVREYGAPSLREREREREREGEAGVGRERDTEKEGEREWVSERMRETTRKAKMGKSMWNLELLKDHKWECGSRETESERERERGGGGRGREGGGGGGEREIFIDSTRKAGQVESYTKIKIPILKIYLDTRCMAKKVHPCSQANTPCNCHRRCYPGNGTGTVMSRNFSSRCRHVPNKNTAPSLVCCSPRRKAACQSIIKEKEKNKNTSSSFEVGTPYSWFEIILMLSQLALVIWTLSQT